jgi:two-component system sensor histidine kinase and response regulator WspE
MSQPHQESAADPALLELFRLEVETHARALEKGLVGAEADPAPERIEPLMRAAHSIKGAARIVGLPLAVTLAHAMEDLLSAAQQGKHRLSQSDVDLLLRGLDVFQSLPGLAAADIPGALTRQVPAIESLCPALAAALQSQPSPPAASERAPAPVTPSAGRPAEPVQSQPGPSGPVSERPSPQPKSEDGSVRVLADNLNRLLGLAGECWVRATDLPALAADLARLKQTTAETARLLEILRQDPAVRTLPESARLALESAAERAERARGQFTRFRDDFDFAVRRLERTTTRLYDEAVATRMRPFADGLHGFPRLVRDLARRLDKKVELVVRGETTRVDRDILDKLEAPLTHLLQNALDHGFEPPAERTAAGKPEQGRLVLQAHHVAGFLQVSVSDDGRGLDLDRLRQKIIARGYVTADMAGRLSQAELLDFLFLPGFSTAAAVTDLSGRGVGLDVVKSMAHEVGGSVRIETRPGQGTTFTLQLPLTLSILPALVVDIAGEPYALPLVRVDRILQAKAADVRAIEDHPVLDVDGQLVGLVNARLALGLPPAPDPASTLSVVVLGDRLKRFGLVVDRLLGQRRLVVQPLDRRLGRIRNISAGAILEDGAPLLILDADDLIQGIEQLLGQGRLQQTRPSPAAARSGGRRRVLVVDDSLTVREVERKLLENRGYEVAVAVDGVDGWNALRAARFDLVITDVDMPRLNGIELVRQIKAHPGFESLPVMIVSYKDREEDRLLGLEAGADYYLAKSSFQDDTLLNAVRDLVGDP